MTPAIGTLDSTLRIPIIQGLTGTTINELSFHNTSTSATCYVKTYWAGREDVHVELDPLERVRMYKGLTLDGTDAISAETDLPGYVVYKANTSQ